MPMSVEGIVAMQACARLGLIHSVVFGGFSAKSLQERIQDAGATLVITADEQVRGGKNIPLKPAVDEAFALGGCESIRHVVVYQRTGAALAMRPGATSPGATTSSPARPTPASPNGSAPSIRCSSCTRRGRPASPRASSTRRAATCCMPC
jgi:acyl-coenzyme A synthetase/AMP-(fatty) acid ligase